MIAQTGHSDVTTQGIRVRVAAELRSESPDGAGTTWNFAYRVVIRNEGTEAATLRSRHWVVRDADARRRDVRGEGVVGAQPRLEPGETFSYESGCSLATHWGTMEGSYRMERDDGSSFEARIGRFFLAPNTAPIGELDAD
ncbi:MAG: Co2+/Mg2+ efflux protein ApaG [Planctomycetota bacterium]